MYNSYGVAFDGKVEWSFGNRSAKNVVVMIFLILEKGPTFGIN